MFDWLRKSRTRTGSKPFRLAANVLSELRRTIGAKPAEQGGVLGGSREDGVVRYFHFDDTARRSAVTYSPNHEFLNRLFAEVWNPQEIHLLGFVHSHPAGSQRPSAGDMSYVKDILAGIPELDALMLPIVMTEPDAGKFEILPFVAYRDGSNVRIEAVELCVIETDDAAPTVEVEIEEIPAVTVTPGPVPAPITPVTALPCAKDSETFRRVVKAYDLNLLQRSRVIYVGTGGAASFVEELARAGVGQHVLIDPDTVSETNLATQQVYRRDIGRPKVDCLAERIRDINPNVLVVPLQRSIDDIDDGEFDFLANGQTPARTVEQTLICGLTDNFSAQARVHRLALQFELPSLCAQVYQEGRGAEITFTHPDTTPACHRCVLGSRYRAFLDEGFQNNVTTDGTPIFATTRLNALKGFLALALLHHGTDHPRWGSMLSRIGNKNLIQIRMDPDLSTTLGLTVFDQVFGEGDTERLFFDEAVWLPQEPESPATGFPTCPDCGGTGSLRDAVGIFEDTRPLRGLEAG